MTVYETNEPKLPACDGMVTAENDGTDFFPEYRDAFFNRIIAGVNIAGGDVEIADVSALQALHDIDLHNNVIYPPAKGPVSLVNSVSFVDIEEYNMSIDGR